MLPLIVAVAAAAAFFLPGCGGSEGKQGPEGPEGPRGPEGSDGRTGRNVEGQPGSDAMSCWVSGSFLRCPDGSAFNLSTLLGDPGETGQVGPRGNPGGAGPQGVQGDLGLTGSQGSQGRQGVRGYTGSRGPGFNIYSDCHEVTKQANWGDGLYDTHVDLSVLCPYGELAITGGCWVYHLGHSYDTYSTSGIHFAGSRPTNRATAYINSDTPGNFTAGSAYPPEGWRCYAGAGNMLRGATAWAVCCDMPE